MQAPIEVQDKLAALARNMEFMEHHRVFAMVDSIESLHTFMQWHVFAVWDFMSLVKRLQRDLTCVTLPWLPPHHTKASRLINEIVLGEETDDLPDRQHASHFDMYLMAMREVGADPVRISQFIDMVRCGMSVESALKQAGAPEAVAAFVQSTVNTAMQGETAAVLGSFFYGREHVIPHMFSHLLKSWTVDPAQAPMFVYYLERHIELDTDSHGPAAQAIIHDMLGDDVAGWHVLLDAALDAVDQRIRLWDGLAKTLETSRMAVPA